MRLPYLDWLLGGRATGSSLPGQGTTLFERHFTLFERHFTPFQRNLTPLRRCFNAISGVRTELARRGSPAVGRHGGRRESSAQAGRVRGPKAAERVSGRHGLPGRL